MDMPFGGDSFDHFRRGRQIRQFETEIRERLNAANDEIVRRIQNEEESEELQHKVVDEMREFFRFSTKLAAQVLADIQRQRAEEIETRLDAEIELFFEETKNHAMKVLAEIKQGHLLARDELINVLEKPVKQVAGAALASAPDVEPVVAAPLPMLLPANVAAPVSAPVPAVVPEAAPAAAPGLVAGERKPLG
jgi:hypothetical protein